MTSRVSIRHVDTCLSCYVLDHCNGEHELLIGVHVDSASTIADVKAAVLDEWRAGDDYGLSDPPSEAEFAEAVNEAFASADPAALFDSRLDPREEADDCSESCQAWFRLSWEPLESGALEADG
jgi:hypothetical protein